jgi:hypothetical protein
LRDVQSDFRVRMASTYLRSSNPKFIKTLQRKDLTGAWPRQT